MRRRVERHPVRTGAVGIAALVVLLAVVVAVPQALYQLRTREYTVELANAAGLTEDAKVHVAGVPAGWVSGIELAGDRARVRLRLDASQPLGEDSSAAVKIASVMGTRYLAVEPRGPGELASGATIPKERTSVPYSLDDISGQATQKSEQLDVPALRGMLSTAQEAAPEDPQLVGQALRGVGGAAAIVDRHEGRIKQLVRGTQEVTAELVGQRGTLVNLLGDADVVLRTLDERRGTIHQLVQDVDALARQLDGFLHQHPASEDIGPLLGDLHGLSESLQRNENALSESMRLLPPAGKGLANATGNGPWGDVEGPAGPLPDNLLCVAGLVQPCG